MTINTFLLLLLVISNYTNLILNIKNRRKWLYVWHSNYLWSHKFIIALWLCIFNFKNERLITNKDYWLKTSNLIPNSISFNFFTLMLHLRKIYAIFLFFYHKLFTPCNNSVTILNIKVNYYELKQRYSW